MTALRARGTRRPHGQLTRQTGPLPGRRPGDLLPGGAKIRGVNITATLAQEAIAAGHYPNLDRWRVMWSQWDATAIQTALDRAVAVGANCVRIQGSPYALYTSTITQAAYFTLWDQLSAWCQQRGLFLYPTGADGGPNDLFGGVPAATQITLLTAWAAHMGTLPDVIGLDLVQENDSYRTSSTALNIYQSVKAVTSLPCTYSTFASMDVTGNLAPTYLADRMDYFDFHVYYGGASTAPLDAYWTAGGTRPVVIGEFSHTISQNFNADAWIQRYNEVKALVTHIGPAGQRVAGAQCWASGDSYPWSPAGSPPFSPGDNFGLFDDAGVERTWITNVLRTFPKV